MNIDGKKDAMLSEVRAEREYFVGLLTYSCTALPGTLSNSQILNGLSLSSYQPSFGTTSHLRGLEEAQSNSLQLHPKTAEFWGNGAAWVCNAISF